MSSEKCGTFYFYNILYKGKQYRIYEENINNFLDDTIQPGQLVKFDISYHDYYSRNLK